MSQSILKGLKSENSGHSGFESRQGLAVMLWARCSVLDYSDPDVCYE